MEGTYYERLGVQPDASQGEIEAAWKEQVKELHPDQNDDPNAAEQFKAVKQAYDVLSVPEQREKYDKLGHQTYHKLQQSKVVGQSANPEQKQKKQEQRERGEETPHQNKRRQQATGRSRNRSSQHGDINWTAHTRDPGPRETINQNKTEHPGRSRTQRTEDSSLLLRLLGYSIIAFPLTFLSYKGFVGLLYTIEGRPSAPISPTATGGVMLALVGFYILSVIAVEHMLNTQQKLFNLSTDNSSDTTSAS